jgi:hypothetical protein
MTYPNLNQIHLLKLLLVVVTLSYWSCQVDDNTTAPNSFQYSFISIEDLPIAQNEQLENWDTTGWGVYEDIIFDGTEIQHHMEHDETTFNTKVLKTQITGGDAYNNAFFTNTIAKRWEELNWYFDDALEFEYILDFYPEVEINCSVSDWSEVEGLEFTMQHVIIPESWGWGIQWSKTNTWSFWNDEKINDEAIGWENINNVNDCILPYEWNSIKIKGIIQNNTLRYTSLSINNNNHDLNIVLSSVSVPEGWSENFIQVGFQINGNSAILNNHNHGVDPVTVYLNNLNLNIAN